MGFPVDDRTGPVLQFAEFSLLPPLLARVPQPPALDDAPDTWRDYLQETGYNTDHIDDGSVDESPTAMAADAWRLAIGLELVAEDGLTDPGQRIAALADRPQQDRTFHRELRRALARQIEACYFGSERSVVRVLQAGARRLANGPWREFFPGLLLIEAQALIQWARPDRRLVGELPERLEEGRKAAVETYGIPELDLTNLTDILGEEEAERFAGRIGLSDAVANYYLDQWDSDVMTVTEMRSTAMLLTFAGLLRERFLLGPVQCLESPAKQYLPL